MPSYEILSAALDTAGVLGDTAELHGQLCGSLCQLGPQGASPWLADALKGASGTPAAQNSAQEMLADLAEATATALDDADMSLVLLLPDDAANLEDRAENLAFWCQGFLHGLSAASADPAALESGTTGEILRDFSEISRAAFADDESAEEGESAYAELIEFVRVSTQLVYEEFRGAQRADQPQASGLH